MNLAKKIVVEVDKGEFIKFVWRFYIKLIFGSVYLKKTKHNNDKIMQIDS